MKSLPGIVLGLAVGALVGILVAPQSGKKTRRKLSSGSDSFFKDLQDQLQSGLDSIKGQYDEYVDTAASRTSEVIGQAKRKIK